MCFPVNIAEFLILTILKNIWKRLLFNFFNGSLLHGPKGLRSMTVSGFRVRVMGLVFVSISRHLSFWSNSQPVFKNLRLQIPLISELSFYIGCFRSFLMVSRCFSSLFTSVCTRSSHVLSHSMKITANITKTLIKIIAGATYPLFSYTYNLFFC